MESLFSEHKQGINLFYILFLDKIIHLFDKHVPVTKLSIKENKNLEKPSLKKDFLNQLSKKHYIPSA